MENNSTQQQYTNPQAEQASQAPQPIAPQVSEVKSRKPLMVVVVVLLWAGSIAGAYFAKDLINGDENKTTETASKESSQNTETSTTKETTDKTTFDYKKAGIPITFQYPSNWVLNTENTLFKSEEVKDNYGFSLLAPSTSITSAMIGGTYIMKGSKIDFYITKVTDVELLAPKLGVKGEVLKTKIAGVDALQYVFAYESDPSISTIFIKDGKEYSISFISDKDNERDSENYKVYEEVLSSLSF